MAKQSAIDKVLASIEAKINELLTAKQLILDAQHEAAPSAKPKRTRKPRAEVAA